MNIPVGIRPYVVLLIGVAGSTFASPFIRLTQQAGMPSLAIASGRLLLATLMFTPFVLRGNGLSVIKAFSVREWLLTLLAGLLLALHFMTFISSLEYIAILTALIFGSTSPFFASIASWLTLGEKIRRPILIGIVITIVGTTLIASAGATGNPPTRPAPLLGNTLAFLGAFFIALYFTVGRYFRVKLDNLTYSWLVFGIAGLMVLAMLPFTGNSLLGHEPRAYFWLVMVTLFAQVVGHSAWNYALGQLSSALVSMIMLLVPISSSITAAIILKENPGGWPVLVGSLIILSGVLLANLSRH